jgi:hypothetical protein
MGGFWGDLGWVVCKKNGKKTEKELFAIKNDYLCRLR